MHSEVLPRQEAVGLGQIPGPALARGLFCISLSTKSEVTATLTQGYGKESRFLRCQTVVWIPIWAFPVTSRVTLGNGHNLTEPSSLG